MAGQPFESYLGCMHLWPEVPDHSRIPSHASAQGKHGEDTGRRAVHDRHFPQPVANANANALSGF